MGPHCQDHWRNSGFLFFPKAYVFEHSFSVMSEWQKIMANETTDKGLISKVCKQLINSRKKKKAQSKNG